MKYVFTVNDVHEIDITRISLKNKGKCLTVTSASDHVRAMVDRDLADAINPEDRITFQTHSGRESIGGTGHKYGVMQAGPDGFWLVTMGAVQDTPNHRAYSIGKEQIGGFVEAVRKARELKRKIKITVTEI